jgi:hypothetical protein
MKTKKYLLIGAAVAAIAGLTAASQATGQGHPVCAPAVCNSQSDPTQPQVQCGTKDGCPVCVDVLPSTTDIGSGSCQFQWNIYNLGTTSTQTAVAYECTPGTAATGANFCGVGSSVLDNAFKDIFQLDSVNATVSTAPPTPRTFSYTINSACAQRGPNDLVVKPGIDSVKTCNGPIEGFGTTNTNATTTACQIQQLGDSECQIQTCFTRGTGNNLIDYTIQEFPAPAPGAAKCDISAQLPLGGGALSGVTDIPDGTIIKFGANSCYQVTYQRKTTWVATAPTTVCPPTT